MTPSSVGGAAPTPAQMLYAYHEAGHACAAWRMGAVIEAINVSSTDPDVCALGGRGFVQTRWSLAGLPVPEGIRRHLLMIYAGPEAQRRHDPRSDVVGCAAQDYADAENWVAVGYASTETRACQLRMIEREARSFVGAEWHCIEALAQALLRTPVLDGPTATAILRLAEVHHATQSGRAARLAPPF